MAWTLNRDERTLRLTLVSVLIPVKKDWRHSETSASKTQASKDALEDAWKIRYQDWRHSETLHYR